MKVYYMGQSQIIFLEGIGCIKIKLKPSKTQEDTNSLGNQTIPMSKVKGTQLYTERCRLKSCSALIFSCLKIASRESYYLFKTIPCFDGSF